MLTESLDVVQVQGEHRRRWFSDDYFDLIVWFDGEDEISGFQLCYDIDKFERALTWFRGKGFSHHAIDAGEDPAGPIKMSPILIADGIFEKEMIIERLEPAITDIDSKIAVFILSKLKEY